MDITKIQQKYIPEFEKETGKKAIWGNGVTGIFKLWLSKKYEQPINNPCNHLFELFLNYFQEHHYITKKQMIAFYIQKTKPSEAELIHTQKKVGTVIRQYVKIGILEKYSKLSYKINKLKLEKIVNMRIN